MIPDKLIKKYGNTIKTATDSKEIAKIPTGVFSLDLLTKGGIPLNKFTVLWGNKSSGKTTLSFKIMNSFIEAYDNVYVVYVDFEHALNKEWMSRFIKDLKRVVIVSPDYGEQGVDIIHELSQEKDIGLIIVDSLGSIISITEIEESSEDSQVASSSRLIRRLLNKLLVSMSIAEKENRPLTTLLINQARSNIGARKFESKMKMPGGYIVNHLSYLTLHLYLKSYTSNDGVPCEAIHNFAIEKNRCGLPKLSGEFVIDLIQGKIKDDNVIMNYAKKYELLIKEKKGFSLCGRKSPTLKKLKEDLEDPQFRQKVCEEIMERWWNGKAL